MDSMAGDLTKMGLLHELDETYRHSQTGAQIEKENLWTSLWDSEGYRHGHDPHPPDDFWFRPLISCTNHVSYVGLIPPKGGVPPSPEEAAVVEMSIYSLGGELGIIVLDADGSEKERFVLPPHQALYAPIDVPVGFWNPVDTTASFMLTFTPTRPGREKISKFRNWATKDAGWKVVSPDFLNEMLGDTLWSMGK